MRKMMLTGILAISAMFAYAQATPAVTETQIVQQKRIRQGVKSGELTRAEAVELQVQQAHVQHVKKQSKEDGVVTAAERARIHAAQNRASRNIAAEKHDRQDRN